MNHLIHDKYLSTWSQIAAYTRIKPNILKKTHDTILRLPYILVSETKFVVEKIIVDRWLAEVNAILQCPDVWDIDTVYVTLSPCIRCTKMLMNTSCKRIVFLNNHLGETGKELWEKTGRTWQHYASYTEDLHAQARLII